MLDRCLLYQDTSSTEIYTLSLHDALPISSSTVLVVGDALSKRSAARPRLLRRAEFPARALHAEAWRPDLRVTAGAQIGRAHVELQSRQYLVCRLLLEKKKDVI